MNNEKITYNAAIEAAVENATFAAETAACDKAAVNAAKEQAAAAAAELDGEATPTVTQAAVDALETPTMHYARAGEYLVNVGKGTLTSLTKAFTAPKKAAADWRAPAVPSGLRRVKIVAYQYGVRDIRDTSGIKGVHSTRYTLRFTFAGGDKYLPQFAANTGFGGVFYAVGPARLDKMVALWGLMREAWNLNAKGETKH